MLKSSFLFKRNFFCIPELHWEFSHFFDGEVSFRRKEYSSQKFFGCGIHRWVICDNGKWQQKIIDFDTSSVANKH